MFHPAIRIIAGIMGTTLLAATIYFLPSFEREFFIQNKDMLGAISFPLLTVSIGTWMISVALNSRIKNWLATIIVPGALLVAAWYIRAFFG